MIPTLFSRPETAFTGAGLGRLADCISCSVTEELNGIFELEFKYPINGPMFSQILPGKIIYSSYDVSGDPQPFDIYAMETNLDGTATYRAQHISYRYNSVLYIGADSISTIIGSRMYSIPNDLKGDITRQYPPICHVKDYAQDKQYFYTSGYPNNTTSDNPMIVYHTQKMVSLREMIYSGGGYDSIVMQGGAELKWNKLAGTFYKRRGQDTSAIIRYASNLTAMRYEYDSSSVVDAVIPYYVEHGQDYDTFYLMDDLESTATSYPSGTIAAPCYGDQIYQRGDNFTAIPLDVTSVFREGRPTADEVYDYAYDYYRTKALGVAYENLTIEFQPLWDAPEYKYISPAEKLKLGDTATVFFPDYGLIKPLRVIKTTWDALKERYTKLEFGNSQRTIFNVAVSGGTKEADPNAGYIINTDVPIDE